MATSLTSVFKNFLHELIFLIDSAQKVKKQTKTGFNIFKPYLTARVEYLFYFFVQCICSYKYLKMKTVLAVESLSLDKLFPESFGSIKFLNHE